MAVELLNGNATEIDWFDPSVLTNGSSIDILVFVAITVGTGGESVPLKITFKHGARHLVETALRSADVEAEIALAVREATKEASAVGEFWGRITVGGRLVEYRAFPVSETHINIGMYYIVP